MKPYHRNPRRITKKRYDRLTDTLARLGDLGGIVHNLETDEIIGGNQRMAVFKDGQPVVIETYDQPDEQGTVAHGFVVWHGKKYAYRQVRWDEKTAEEANIAANIGAGTWDWDALSGWDAGALQEWGFDAETLQGWRTDVGALDAMLTADDWENAVSGLPDEDRAPFQQMTFTLRDEQAETVKQALGLAKDMGEFVDTGNENSNGNALALICETFITEHGS